MPTTKLTQLGIAKLRPPKTGRVTHWDRLLPSFGLMITSNDARSWKCAYRVSRKLVIETLGTLKQIPRVDTARDMARASMVKARQGINPVEERKRTRAEQEAAAARSVSVAIAFERYIEMYAKQKQGPSTLAETQRVFRQDIFPKWGKRSISAITDEDVRRVRDEIDERAPIQANRVLEKVKSFFAWALREKYVTSDPTKDVTKIATEVERDRWLTDDEIIRFWLACDQLGWPYGRVFQLLLVTAQRRDEVGELQWSELKDKGVWLLPGARTKNGNEHEIHLSPLALEIINSLPRTSEKFVFSVNGTTPVTGWSTAKNKLDALIGDIEPWRLHDLRRTTTTNMAKLGIPPHVADKVLNHTGGTINGVAAVYNRFEYINERREALDKWSQFLETLVRPPANVVHMVAR